MTIPKNPGNIPRISMRFIKGLRILKRSLDNAYALANCKTVCITAVMSEIAKVLSHHFQKDKLLLLKIEQSSVII